MRVINVIYFVGFFKSRKVIYLVTIRPALRCISSLRFEDATSIRANYRDLISGLNLRNKNEFFKNFSKFDDLEAIIFTSIRKYFVYLKSENIF